MAYFKLSLLTKAYDQDNLNKYIKNVISEFYSNNVNQDLLQYEKENNTKNLKDNLTNIYTKTYTYNEKLNIHQQAQKDLTFSLDKMILDDDTWKDNPFASKIKIGSQLLLEYSYNNKILFSVKSVTYTITENNIVYNFTCQDSFSYQLAKQSDGYTINNDINSKDFIGALNIDNWTEKIVNECKISYKYLKLEVPLYLCDDGTVINTTARKSSNKKIVKTLKNSYSNTMKNADLYETIPFSCSSTTANGALISLGEQIGMVLNTATVLLEPENMSNFITLVTYFWFEPSKKDMVNGLQYSPFRNIKTFSLSQQADSLVTVLNINSRTLSSDEVITALPKVSPFFITYFDSTYWRKFSKYYTGMYTNILYGPQYRLTKPNGTFTLIRKNNRIIGIKFTSYTLSNEEINLFKLYPLQVFKTQNTVSQIQFSTIFGDLKIITPDNSNFSMEISGSNIIISVKNENDFADYSDLKDYDISIFFKVEYSDEDIQFARIADQLPWLENKLIDFNYFINAGLLSKIQEKDINNRIYNDLRKINSDILLNAENYYSRLHSQTKYIAEMTNNIDMVGAEVSSIEDIYKKKGKAESYDKDNLLQRWNLLQSNISGATDASQTDIKGSYLSSTFMDLYGTTSDYMRKYLDARQRCLKNLYNFRKYFETPLDPLYNNYYHVVIDIKNDSGNDRKNFYYFEPFREDKYAMLSSDFVNNYSNFFIFDEEHRVKDYNNIQLYYNNTQHTIFNKDSHLLTENNYKDINVYCYQDILEKTGSEDNYNKDINYLREVCFIKKEDFLNICFNDVENLDHTLVTEANTFFSFYIKYNGDNNKYWCTGKFYDWDSNYIIFNKLYEDGRPFADATFYSSNETYIVINGQKIEQESDIALDNIIYKDREGLNEIDGTIDFSKNKNIFYQEISPSEILRNYLYRNRNTLNVKAHKKFKNLPLTDLFYNNDSLIIETNSTFEPKTANRTYYGPDELSGHTNYPGWGIINNFQTMSWYIVSGLLSWTQIPILDWKEYILVQGGYTKTPTHRQDSDRVFKQYSPYISPKGKNDSLYIKEYPLASIFDKNGKEMQLVTNTNYQNFYTRISNKNNNASDYNLAGNGTYCSVDDTAKVAESLTELHEDFISDFPYLFFYTTKPVDGNDPSEFLAYTFGNIAADFNAKGKGEEGSKFKNYTYRQTKTYIKKTTFNTLEDDLSYLIIYKNTFPNYTWPDNLNEYTDYDIIKEGEFLSGSRIKADDEYDEYNYVIYLILNGVVENIASSFKEFFTSELCDENGRSFNITKEYDKTDIVKNLYYIKENVKVSPSSIGYDLKAHLLDNTYELYNDQDERVYTINQIFNNLLYKTNQTYNYDVFDKTISQTIRLYRYNSESITPDIIAYDMDISNIPDDNQPHELHGYGPYGDFKYEVTIQSNGVALNNATNGDFWYKYTIEDTGNNLVPMRERAALIESNLQLYWNEAYAASLLCDIFVPSDWRIKEEKVTNHFSVIFPVYDENKNFSYVDINTAYVPIINQTIDKQFIVIWKDMAPQLENSEIYTYSQLSIEQQSEVDNMLKRTQNVSTEYLWFNKIADKVSFYTIQTGGCTWNDFLNQALGLNFIDYVGWNGIAITYLTSHFVDAGISSYEKLLQKREDLWRDFYEEYPYLFLETSYSNDSVTTSEDLLMMAKYAFEDQKYPEKSYSISLIDLVQDVETLDNEDGTYNPKYYRWPELQIGEGIRISAEDYTSDRDDIYNALSQLLFITDISRDLRNDGDCQLTVNTIKYQDKLIRRLAKMIRNNPLN